LIRRVEMARYLVVHPKLSVEGDNGMMSALKAGSEVSLDINKAENFVKKGFLKLVVAKVPPKKKDISKRK